MNRPVYTIEPLEWIDSDEEESYIPDCDFFASTEHGTYAVQQFSIEDMETKTIIESHWFFSFLPNGLSFKHIEDDKGRYPTFESAQEAAEKHWLNSIGAKIV